MFSFKALINQLRRPAQLRASRRAIALSLGQGQPYPATETKQRIFEYVACHIFHQGEQAITNSGTCMYRGSEGTACAVGCLIPSENYSPSFERNVLATLVAHDKYMQEMVGDKLSLLSDLQTIHDRGYNWCTTEVMQSALREVAKKHKLHHYFIGALMFADR